MTRSILPVLIVLAALAGCARRESTEDAAGGTTAPAGGSTPAEPAPDQAAPADSGAMPAPPAAESTSPADAAVGEPDQAPACDAEPVQRFVGETYTPELGEQARVAAGAKVARALRPGEVVTMEYRYDRLTLTLDESGRISNAACG